eukprot:g48882.t1
MLRNKLTNSPLKSQLTQCRSYHNMQLGRPASALAPVAAKPEPAPVQMMPKREERPGRVNYPRFDTPSPTHSLDSERDKTGDISVTSSGGYHTPSNSITSLSSRTSSASTSSTTSIDSVEHVQEFGDLPPLHAQLAQSLGMLTMQEQYNPTQAQSAFVHASIPAQIPAAAEHYCYKVGDKGVEIIDQEDPQLELKQQLLAGLALQQRKEREEGIDIGLSANMYEQFFRQSAVAIIVATEGMQTVDVNDAFAEMCGTTRREILSRQLTCRDFSPKSEVDYQLLQKIQSNGTGVACICDRDFVNMRTGETIACWGWCFKIRRDARSARASSKKLVCTLAIPKTTHRHFRYAQQPQMLLPGLPPEIMVSDFDLFEGSPSSPEWMSHSDGGNEDEVSDDGTPKVTVHS